MAQVKLTDEEVKKMMGEDYFYEYGLDPSLKQLASIIQNNTYDGKLPI